MTASLTRPRRVANLGVGIFADELERQGIALTRIAWNPPAPEVGDLLSSLVLEARATAKANGEALDRMRRARPRLTGVVTGRDVIGASDARTFLHAGPPVAWDDMCGPLRGAICGAAVYEGLADSPEEAAAMAERGSFAFVPCHDRATVGPMAGVVSASMSMWQVEEEIGGRPAYCSFNEGLGKVLRYGANDRGVLDRLRWIDVVLAPMMRRALERRDDPLDLRATIAQALQMGDECHNRNRAGTSLFLREIVPELVELGEPSARVGEVVRFLVGNDHSFLNLAMPACKAIADAGSGVPGSSVVVALARNGTEFGIRVSGLGDRWFTGPAGAVEGLYFPGFTREDANPDIGDSAITETVGLGGFAMAAAPAIVRFVGGHPSDAVAATERMYEICAGESAAFQIPVLGFRGSPLGIDVREVVHLGVLPIIDTGIAHRDPGVGQVGAGLVEPPMQPFVDAARTLAGEAGARR